MEELRARVFCIPSCKGNHKKIIKVGGKPRIVSSAKNKRAEQTLAKLLAIYAPPEPFDGPLALRLTIHHGVPPSWAKWRTAAALAGVVVPSGNGTPDVGNVLKLVEDAMESAAWLVDDARTVEYQIDARYSERPGYTVHLARLPGRRGPKTKRADTPPSPTRRREYYSPSSPEIPCAVSEG